MRQPIPVYSFLVGGLFLFTLPATGCDRSCRSDATCRRPPTGGGEGTSGESGSGDIGGAGGSGGATGTGGAADCPDDPAEGEVRPSCGVWVSASLGDNDNDGTQGSPVKTLSRGIELAALAENGEKRVYACEGTYPEPVVLPGGLSLFGGFECPDTGGWKYVGFERRAVVHAPPGPVALVLTAGEQVSFIGDIKVVASDAIEPGGSSIAVLALPGSKAHFPRAEMIAGNAADGADGDDGSPDGQPAQGGSNGNNGADACTWNVGLGGLAVAMQCDGGAQSVSGQGGNGNKLAANDGGDGLLPPDPNEVGHGEGGKGENAAKGTVCTGGGTGAHGKDGFHGFGALGPGRLTKDGYLGVWGGSGESGSPGQGGGGGGGALGTLCGGPLFGGSGGGSGGSGGCGGKAGQGGQPGGSSIGIAILSEYITSGSLVITAGDGGNGGNGGKLQSGGLGGLPGYGGLGVGGAGGPKDGCGGGLGGNGGKGGNGGGGHGGHSLAVAGVEFSLPFVKMTVTTGQYGFGGLGGDPGAVAAVGESGGSNKVGTLYP